MLPCNIWDGWLISDRVMDVPVIRAVLTWEKYAKINVLEMSETFVCVCNVEEMWITC